MDTSDNFFLSRKNLIGMVLAAAIIVVHLVLGLGFLWPVVALAAWGAGVALTPAPRQQALPPAPERPDADELLRRLDLSTRELYSAGPAAPVLDATAALRGSLLEVLLEWDHLGDVPEQRVVIETIIDDYLPRTLRAYLAITERQHPVAIAETVDSLGILQEEATRIHRAVVNDTLRELEDQTRALRLQFGRLPGPGYDTES
ncbi:hypothetical protein [Corynebacterium nasicanis]|uniref:Secreted protein n=1 Tax=Corynebacterium nasicanis TaxID=1448267 RepID=A0ABW1QB90_9CORY